jgi:uncharacterized protein YkwD
MPWGTRAAAIAAVAGCMLGAPGGAHACSHERALVDAVNRVREAHGLAALRRSPELARSAGRYARWMLRADFFGHRRRIATNARFRQLGENLALEAGGRPHAGEIVRAWMRSPVHRSLILAPRYGWAGAGMARGRMGARPTTAWVMHFGG